MVDWWEKRRILECFRKCTMSTRNGLLKALAVVTTLLTLACITLLYQNSTMRLRAKPSGRTVGGRGDDQGQSFFDMLDGESESSGSSDSDGSDEANEEEDPWMTNELAEPTKKLGSGADASTSDSKNWKIRILGSSGPTSYLRTITFRTDVKSPLVGGKKHFSGTARLASGQRVNLHLSSPPGDPFWYITLGDTIHRSADGSNLTPVIGFSKCSSPDPPWQIGCICEWTLHEGKEIGWKVKPKVRLIIKT